MRRALIFAFFILLCNINNSSAQFAADKDAAYLATLKAVADFKINDEEELENVNRLRQDQQFNRKLYQWCKSFQTQETKTAKISEFCVF